MTKQSWKLRTIAIASVVLLLAVGATYFVTAEAPRAIDNLDTYLATTMEADVLLVDSESGVPVTPHGHAANGSATPVSIVFTQPTYWQSFSVAMLSFEPLHATKSGCPHPYGFIDDGQGKCWFDGWHGTPCALRTEGGTGSASQACVDHKARYGEQPPYRNTGYPDSLRPSNPSNPDLCDPQTPSNFCNNPNPGTSPISDKLTGCSSGKCTLTLGLKSSATGKNLATPIKLAMSASTRSASEYLRGKAAPPVEIPYEGGSSQRIEFTWPNTPAKDLAGVSFTVAVLATSTDLQGLAVSAEDSTTITPALPDGELRVSISPASINGLGYRDGMAETWSERMLPRARAS